MSSPLKWLIKWEFDRVLKKIVPRKFSFDENNDFFMVELRNATEPKFELFVQRVTEHYFEGLSREGHSYEWQTCLSWKFVKPSDIHVRRFLGNVQVQYTGFWDFFWGETFLHAERAQIKERFSQWLFNKRTKFRRNRMDLLRDMLELTIKGHLEKLP